MVGKVAIVLLLFVTALSPCVVLSDTLPATAYPLKLQSGYYTQQLYLGRTVGERDTDIGFELAGYIKKLAVNDGQVVRKNQTLATLDTSRLLQQYKILQAERRSIVPELALARKNTKRQLYLYRRRLGSELEYDRELTRSRSLEAELARVDADLGRIQIELDKSTLLSPFHAVVLTRYVHEGAYVQSGERVMRLQQLDIREAHIGVPEKIAQQLKKGQCYPITVEHKSYRGCISQIVPQLSAATQTVRIIFQLTTTHAIINGQLASFAWRQFQPVAGVWVPTAALMSGRRGTWQVYGLRHMRGKPNSQLQVVPVTVQVIYSDGARSYISADFGEVKSIIAAGAHKYSPYSIVTQSP